MDAGFFAREDRELFAQLVSDQGIRAIEAAVQYGRKNPSLNEGEIVVEIDPIHRMSYLEFDEDDDVPTTESPVDTQEETNGRQCPSR